MKVGCAAICQNQKLLKHLPNESSIDSTEVTASDLVMNIIVNHKSSNFIIHSDSKSVLQALQNKNTSTLLITRLLDKMNTLSKNNSIILTRILSHIGIHGNEKALLADISNTKIPYTDLKPIINKFILKKWQKSWDDQKKKRKQASPYTRYHWCEWLSGYRRNKKDIIHSWLFIGHTHITHSHLLKREGPQYAQCAKYPSQSNAFS